MRQSYVLFTVVAATLFVGSAFWPGFGDAVQTGGMAKSAAGVIGRSQNCSVENESWPVPANINPKCYRCFCKDGVVRCEATPKCENLGFCPAIVYNETKNPCCPRKCKSCDYLGQEYGNDEQWLSSQDTCRMLTCKGGVVTMSRMECVTMCSNPENVVGYCCPLCPRAMVKNISIGSSAEREIMKDPCVQCSCTDRWCHCFKTACPALDCSVDNQFTPVGRCCPECKRSRNFVSLPANRCSFSGIIYKNEQNFRPDECTLCKCQDGTVICRRFVCPILDCPKQRIQYEPGLCCPRCRDTDPLPCDDKGTQYKHGDQWSPNLCTRCKCSNGVIRCDSVKCTELLCPRGYRATPVIGKCCPQCEETDGICTVFGDPHYQTFDGRSFNFQGSCRYVLTKTCDNNPDKSLTGFTVVVQNEPRGNNEYAWTRHVSIRLASGARIALLPGKKVRLNRKPLKLPHIEIEKGIFSVTFDRQSNVLLRVGKDLKIVWDGNSYVEVTLSKKYKNRVCGLCGNYNNDSMDDFEKADGTGPGSVYSFGQSWRVGTWKSCKSARDRQYHQKLEREKKRMRYWRRKQENSSFWNVYSDNGGQMSFQYEDNENEKGHFVPLKRMNPAKAEQLLKLLTSSSATTEKQGQITVDHMGKVENAIGNDESTKLDGNLWRSERQRRRHQLRKICAGGSARWRTRRESIQQCRLLKSKLFASCHQLVPVKRYFRSCVMDTCACPPSGRCHCEALLAYAMRCEKENVFIDWRSHSSCVSGDSKCAMEGAVFSPCAPTCIRTCWMLSTGSSCPSSSSTDTCSPGCYCPDGTAQLLNQCVPISLCPQSAAGQPVISN